MTTEAKVGAFTLLGLALFGFILVYLGNIKVGGDKDYTIYAGFNQVMGLSKGSSVRYAGVAAGQVVSLEPDGVGVRVGVGWPAPLATTSLYSLLTVFGCGA